MSFETPGYFETISMLQRSGALTGQGFGRNGKSRPIGRKSQF